MMNIHRARPAIGFIAFVAAAFFLNSCSIPGQGSDDGNIEDEFSRFLSTYQILNLNTGIVTGYMAVPDLQTNIAYRQNLMVFKQIPTGSTQIGTQTGSLGASVDPAATSTSLTQYYMGVFEVTQAQWQIIAGTTPWTSVSVFPSNAFGSTTTNDQNPAFGLSQDMVSTALTAYNSGKTISLTLPTNAMWERAARAGSANSFAWGAGASDSSVIANYAIVAETVTTPGVRQVGERTPNALGLFDMHGNVWELTHTGLSTSIRGGSWRDSASLSRSGHVVSIDRGSAHGLVGARLVLVP